jgi:phosphotransferase system enzyme I (PtsI)
MTHPDDTDRPAPEPPPPPPQHKRLRRPAARAPERRLAGIPVSAGIAIGAVYGNEETAVAIAPRQITAAETDAEITRLDSALSQSAKQLAKLRARLSILPEESQAEIAPMLDVYVRMLGPSRLVRGIRRRIAEALNAAETAVQNETEAIVAQMQAQAKLMSPRGSTPRAEDRASLARRIEEVREVARRLLRNLTRTPFRSFASLPEGSVLVCETLRPSDAALLDPARLAGVATEEGGADGHTAVMLRALGVPAVLGVAGLGAAARSGDLAVIDGAAGLVTLHPSAASLAAARRAMAAFTRERQRYARLRRLPAQTRDGEAVELQGNLELPIELPLIAQAGAQGIGLLRTEFLFMNRETLPDEDTQTENYRTIVDAMGGDAVTIRVLDWGGEKDIEALHGEGLVPEEAAANPALGLRGIRMLLRRPALLETQFAAILRASAAGPVRVMLPMVTNVAEVRQAREVYDRVARRLRRGREKLPEKLPPLGIMIETPGAALSADALALEADFFAIGTNDLTAYTLAVDRGETDVAELYDPLHPAVLRLIQFATEAALRMRRPVSVCGEMAADPRLTPLLLGIGLRSFSMNASALPRVKQVVRSVEIAECARFARRVMEQSDPAAIRELIAGFRRDEGRA